MSNSSLRYVDHTYRDYSRYIDEGGRLIKHKKCDANFPSKVHRMLEDDAENSHVITWMPHGRAFKVLNKQLLISETIPKYFVCKKYESFTRQLNGWGFKRLYQTGPDLGCYYHECFLRGLPKLTRMVRRLPPNLGKATPYAAGEPNFYRISEQYTVPPTTGSNRLVPLPAASALEAEACAPEAEAAGAPPDGDVPQIIQDPSLSEREIETSTGTQAQQSQASVAVVAAAAASAVPSQGSQASVGASAASAVPSQESQASVAASAVPSQQGQSNANDHWTQESTFEPGSAVAVAASAPPYENSHRGMQYPPEIPNSSNWPQYPQAQVYHYQQPPAGSSYSNAAYPASYPPANYPPTSYEYSGPPPGQHTRPPHGQHFFPQGNQYPTQENYANSNQHYYQGTQYPTLEHYDGSNQQYSIQYPPPPATRRSTQDHQVIPSAPGIIPSRSLQMPHHNTQSPHNRPRPDPIIYQPPLPPQYNYYPPTNNAPIVEHSSQLTNSHESLNNANGSDPTGPFVPPTSASEPGHNGRESVPERPPGQGNGSLEIDMEPLSWPTGNEEAKPAARKS